MSLRDNLKSFYMTSAICRFKTYHTPYIPMETMAEALSDVLVVNEIISYILAKEEHSIIVTAISIPFLSLAGYYVGRTMAHYLFPSDPPAHQQAQPSEHAHSQAAHHHGYHDHSHQHGHGHHASHAADIEAPAQSSHVHHQPHHDHNHDHGHNHQHEHKHHTASVATTYGTKAPAPRDPQHGHAHHHEHATTPESKSAAHDHDDHHDHQHSTEEKVKELAVIGIPFGLLCAAGTYDVLKLFMPKPVSITFSVILGVSHAVGNWALHSADDHAHGNMEHYLNIIRARARTKGGECEVWKQVGMAQLLMAGVFVGHICQGFFSGFAFFSLLMSTPIAATLSAIVAGLVMYYEGRTEAVEILKRIAEPENIEAVSTGNKAIVGLAAGVHGAIPCAGFLKMLQLLPVAPSLEGRLIIAVASLLTLGVANARGAYSVIAKNLDKFSIHESLSNACTGAKHACLNFCLPPAPF